MKQQVELIDVEVAPCPSVELIPFSAFVVLYKKPSELGTYGYCLETREEAINYAKAKLGDGFLVRILHVP